MAQQDVPTDFVTRLTGLTMNPEPIRQPITDNSNTSSNKPNESNTATTTTLSTNNANIDASSAIPNSALPTASSSTTATSADDRKTPNARNSDLLVDRSTTPSSIKANHQPDVTLRALVTTREAGVIIGKEGKNVAAVREATGVRAGVSKVVPASSERILTVGGPLDAVAKAFSLMAKNLIDNPTTPSPSGNPTETALIRLLVSHQVMGSIIGKGGARIKEIQEESGARIGVRKEMLPQSTERIVDISGLVDSIQIAVFYIGECIFEDADRAVGTILYNPATPPPPPSHPHRGGYHDGRGRGRPKYDDRTGEYDDGNGHQPQHYNSNYYSNSYRSYNNNRRPSANYNNDPSTPQSHRPSRGAYYSNNRGGGLVGGMVGPRGASTNGASSGKHLGNNPQPSSSAADDDDQELVQKTTSIPADMVGCIIGRGGSVINQIRMQSGAKISISKTTDMATNERTFTLEGTQSALDQALSLLYKQLENEKARRLANANGSSGNGSNNSNGTNTGNGGSSSAPAEVTAS
ncbi:hypothetical protein SeLEV6574_g05125 [Synchytrium endobioticum]|uniref:K Homology domain-containing protein n=1 Tax=Synchytrium endobioticum TaxID=286115 RepID=A0A507CVW3_9FUNG|nr:hypothetical protein SeLEV6574_g05125 [Synchytrium endobioticum]